MVDGFLKALDKAAAVALQQCGQPYICPDISYEAGRRIGILQGLALARKTIDDLHNKDEEKDDDL